jgi:hypothetical protein
LFLSEQQQELLIMTPFKLIFALDFTNENPWHYVDHYEWWMEDLFLEWMGKSLAFSIFLLVYCCEEQPPTSVFSSVD